MPPHTTARTGLEVDRVTHTIRFVRSFDAPAELGSGPIKVLAEMSDY